MSKNQTALVPVEDKNLSKAGRHTKLTPELIAGLSVLVSAGNYLVTACNALGIGKTTFYRWLEQAAKDEEADTDSLFRDFGTSIKKAEAEAEQLMVGRLREAALPGLRKTVTKTDSEGNTTVEQVETGGDWLSAATFLERRHPERWGRKDRSTLVVEETKQIVITTVEVVKDYGQGRTIVEGEAKEIEESEQTEDNPQS